MLLVDVTVERNPLVGVWRMRIPQGLEARGKLLLEALFLRIRIGGSPHVGVVFQLHRLDLGGDAARPGMAGQLPPPSAPPPKTLCPSRSPPGPAAKTLFPHPPPPACPGP